MAPLGAVLAGRPDAAANPAAMALSAGSLRSALREATGHRGFWYLNLGFAVCGFQVLFIAIHLPAYLSDAGLSGECLGVEFTESIFVDSPEENMSALQGIKDMGVEISIGHFGTGHSSLSYLRSFPVDQVKIDRSFVKDIPENTDNAAIVASFIPMTHSLGMTVVADGVENTAQLDFLKDRGCDEYLGERLSEPLPAQEFLCKMLTE